MVFFFSSRRRHTRFKCDWSSDVCSSDLLIRRADWKVGHGEFAGALEDADRAIAEFPGDDPQSRNVKAKAFNVKANAHNRSEERRVGKECRSRWSPYH